MLPKCLFRCKSCKVTVCDACYESPTKAPTASVLSNSAATPKPLMPATLDPPKPPQPPQPQSQPQPQPQPQPPVAGRLGCEHGTYKSYQAPSDKMKCGVCGTGLAKGAPFFGCKPCRSTLCGGCHAQGGAGSGSPPPPPGEPADCPAKHGLKSYQTPSDKMKCGTCGASLAKGGAFWGCKPCKTTMCDGCYKRA